MSDNDNQVYMTQIIDPQGLTGLIVPRMFHSEADELKIRTLKRRVMFSCAWNFCRAAHESIELYSQQTVYTDETDGTGRLRDVLESMLLVYGQLDINDVMRFMPACRKLAFRRKLIWNSRFQAWLDSAGRAYNEMTREEKAINQTD